VSGSNLLTYHLPLQQEIWLAVYSRSNLIGVTYIHLSLTYSSIDPSIAYLTRGLRGIFFFFTKKVTQKLGVKIRGTSADLNTNGNYHRTGYKSKSPLFKSAIRVVSVQVLYIPRFSWGDTMQTDRAANLFATEVSLGFPWMALVWLNLYHSAAWIHYLYIWRSLMAVNLEPRLKTREVKEDEPGIELGWLCPWWLRDV